MFFRRPGGAGKRGDLEARIGGIQEIPLPLAQRRQRASLRRAQQKTEFSLVSTGGSGWQIKNPSAGPVASVSGRPVVTDAVSYSFPIFDRQNRPRQTAPGGENGDSRAGSRRLRNRARRPARVKVREASFLPYLDSSLRPMRKFRGLRRRPRNDFSRRLLYSAALATREWAGSSVAIFLHKTDRASFYQPVDCDQFSFGATGQISLAYSSNTKQIN